MASLQWIGKEAVVNHHREVPYRLLKAHADLSVGEDGGVASGNLLVQGDNLEALKALLPYYGGKVKCIYIDPPYNTGNEGWVYNDNVNSPQIRAWLEKTLEGSPRAVGKEGEDLSRHDKWLCMMYPRLALLREFLTEDGAIFVSIDDNEVHHLRCMMDEIYGRQNFVVQIEWQKRYTRSNNTDGFTTVVEHLVVYQRSAAFKPNLELKGEEAEARYRNPDNDPRGPWKAIPFLNPLSPKARPNLCYTIVQPNTKKKLVNTTKAWRSTKEVFDELAADNRVYWGADGKSDTPNIKKFLAEVRTGMPPVNFWTHEFAGHTDEANSEIKQIFGDKVFDTPKPSQLIKRVVEHAANPHDGSIIMDSFAGSGTTGHAVLAMNKADGGNRKFILVEMDEAIATTITRERLARVVEGYHPGGDKKKPKVEGLGGGFRYASLGPTLFDEYGRFRTGEDKVTFAALAAHIYFTQTGEPLPKAVTGKKSPLIGAHGHTAYYLLYNGILGDKTPDGGNVLTRDVLAKLPPHPRQNALGDAHRVVFGEACRLGESTLKAANITFKQIPYQVEVG